MRKQDKKVGWIIYKMYSCDYKGCDENYMEEDYIETLDDKDYCEKHFKIAVDEYFKEQDLLKKIKMEKQLKCKHKWILDKILPQSIIPKFKAHSWLKGELTYTEYCKECDLERNYKLRIDMKVWNKIKDDFKEIT